MNICIDHVHASDEKTQYTSRAAAAKEKKARVSRADKEPHNTGEMSGAHM
jgi:hypothetical protein